MLRLLYDERVSELLGRVMRQTSRPPIPSLGGTSGREQCNAMQEDFAVVGTFDLAHFTVAFPARATRAWYVVGRPTVW